VLLPTHIVPWLLAATHAAATHAHSLSPSASAPAIEGQSLSPRAILSHGAASAAVVSAATTLYLPLPRTGAAWATQPSPLPSLLRALEGVARAGGPSVWASVVAGLQQLLLSTSREDAGASAAILNALARAALALELPGAPAVPAAHERSAQAVALAAWIIAWASEREAPAIAAAAQALTRALGHSITPPYVCVCVCLCVSMYVCVCEGVLVCRVHRTLYSLRLAHQPTHPLLHTHTHTHSLSHARTHARTHSLTHIL
jgi:hypothetical protein